MKIVFNDESFAFEFVRNIGFTYYGGADIGEMIAASGRISEGDLESWYSEWNQLGQRILSRAYTSLAAEHLVSAREGFLRASTYFRMADFYLHGNPEDPRIIETSSASERAYAKAAELTGPTWERVEIPYEGTTLPGYLYKVDDTGQPRPTIIFHGGFDSSLEELFYFAGAPAVRRGYNCLTFDGPGQGMPLRRDKLVFRHDWENVVTPVVDYVLTRPEIDGNNLVLLGMSLGGIMAPRAAAFEHRFKAAIFYGGIYDFHEVHRTLLPKDAVAALDAGDEAGFEKIVADAAQHNTGLRWLVDQGTWSFGASNFADYVAKTRDWTMEGIADRIRCSCLVMDADGDIFFKGQPQKIFEALRAPKRLVGFSSEDGAENHCQSGALAFKDQVVFDWLDETLKA